MYIPTKEDFINNRNQAHENLYLYIISLLGTEQNEDDIQDLSIRFFESSKLSGFFDEFGEIRGHEKEFKLLCQNELKEIKSGSGWDYRGFSLEEDRDEVEIASDKQQFYKYQEQEVNDSLDEDYIRTEENGTCLDKLIELIKSLPDREQIRFQVAYLAIQNTLDISAKKPPTDMPKEVRAIVRERAKGTHIKYEEKRKILEGAMYPTGFWQKYHELVGKNLLNKEFKQQNEIYRKLYKKAKFSNITRDRKKMAEIVELLSSELEDNIKKKIKKDIQKFLCRTSLTPIPQEVQSIKDQMLAGENKRPCKEYVEFIPLYLQESMGCYGSQRDLKWEERVALYLEHRQNCKRCQNYEKQLRQRMEYRIARIKEVGNKPPYPYHEYDPKKVEKRRQKDLVSYYEREYKYNPCDMNLFYLLLAYKNAGEIQKAKTLLETTKDIHEYQEIRNTIVATQIQGV